jgi:hypothetical protein
MHFGATFEDIACHKNGRLIFDLDRMSALLPAEVSMDGDADERVTVMDLKRCKELRRRRVELRAERSVSRSIIVEE